MQTNLRDHSWATLATVASSGVGSHAPASSTFGGKNTLSVSSSTDSRGSNTVDLTGSAVADAAGPALSARRERHRALDG